MIMALPVGALNTFKSPQCSFLSPKTPQASRMSASEYVPSTINLEDGLILVSVFISGFGYGVCATLFCASFGILRRIARGDQRRLHIYLMCYITFMFLLSTLQGFVNIGIIVEIIWDIDIVSDNASTSLMNVGILLSTWGADGCLMWRCATVYEGSSKTTGRVLKVFISLLVCVLFAASVTVIVKDFIPGLSGNADPRFSFAFVCASLFINFTMTSSIVLRLIFLNRGFKKNLGPQCALPYTGIINMIVDSAALIVVFDATYMITRRIPGTVSLLSSWLMLNYSMVYVIAPLSIIHRVAQARAFQPTSTKPRIPDIETSEHGQRELPVLRFSVFSVESTRMSTETNVCSYGLVSAEISDNNSTVVKDEDIHKHDTVVLARKGTFKTI
ncbi:hypothetical protein B0H34DRAFT_79658 [Crassisporium funariophilum]|nr:hypothetical protein B0H34DRAFT_79658 [Crassisporium funariophilum]